MMLLDQIREPPHDILAIDNVDWIFNADLLAISFEEAAEEFDCQPLPPILALLLKMSRAADCDVCTRRECKDHVPRTIYTMQSFYPPPLSRNGNSHSTAGEHSRECADLVYYRSMVEYRKKRHYGQGPTAQYIPLDFLHKQREYSCGITNLCIKITALNCRNRGSCNVVLTGYLF